MLLQCQVLRPYRYTVAVSMQYKSYERTACPRPSSAPPAQRDHFFETVRSPVADAVHVACAPAARGREDR